MHTPDDISIRPASIEDLPSLQRISRQTFCETFSAGNTAENMQQYLDEAFSTARLAAELRDDDASFYFAELDQQVIGYLKLNRGSAQTELKDAKALEIERIYVLKEFYGKKVGQLLYEKAMDIARMTEVDYVWLGVWEENPRAIAFYQKNGFVAFDKHIFRLGDDEQTDIMMKRTLK